MALADWRMDEPNGPAAVGLVGPSAYRDWRHMINTGGPIGLIGQVFGTETKVDLRANGQA